MASTSTPVKVYVTCAGLLYGKFLVTTMIQATKTFAAGMRSPEDSGRFLARGRPQNYGLVPVKEDAAALKAKETEIRWKRIVMNDVESIPLALLVFGAGVMANGRADVQIGTMVLYTASRFCHTVAYAKGLQPHRGYCWRVGTLVTLTAAINAIVAVYK